VTASGTPVTSVAAGAVVTLTATVLAGATPVSPGRVTFCDAAGAHCEDSHLLGTAQLTSTGTATLRFIPAMGQHSYKAVFAGTTGYAISSSGSSALNVTGTHATTTAIYESGSVGNYSLTATVTGVSGVTSPSGNVSFLDTSNSGASLGSGLLAPGSPSLSWLNSQTPAAGADPQGIATADFNGDGIPDLAVADYYAGTVTILLGNGDGTFTQKAVIPDIYSAQSIVAADFNGDGIPDLAVTLSGYDSAVILLGNGDGTFTQVKYLLSTGALPEALVAADFNGDGIPDLAVANLIDNSISIFLGYGDGTFSPGPVIQVSGAPEGLAVADFNGDGKPDLAAAVANSNNGFVEVLLGDGDGNFTPATATLPVGIYPSAIVSADFNGDGIPDVAVAINSNNTLEIFLGNGDGTFYAAAQSPAAGTSPVALLSADFNADGIPDLAVADSGTVTVLLGNGDGTFTTASNNAAPGTSPNSIVTADFNGDGIPDLATANYATNSASVFLTQLKQTAAATVNGLSPSGAGSHLVDASYPGDTNYSSSVSTTVTLAGLVTPTVTVTPSTYSITTAQSLSVTITVTGTPTPTGSVTLTSGSYASAATSLSGGSTTIVIPAGA